MTDQVRTASADTETSVQANPSVQQKTWKRIGILQCIEHIDDSALRYLILSMNSVQDTFQFEFVPFDTQDQFLRPFLAKKPFLQRFLDKIPPLWRLLDRMPIWQRFLARTAIGRPTSGRMLEFHHRQTRYFEGEANAYELEDEPPDYFHIISEARFRGNYFFTSNGFLSIIALGSWKRQMAPPSILEFIQVLVLQGALLTLGSDLRTHLGTRGCLMDFDARLPDTRQKILAANICHECAAIISGYGYQRLVEELRPLLSKSWLDDPADPASPAAIISKLKHDLFITKGLEPSLIERARMSLTQEGFKLIPTIIALVIAAIIISLLGVVTAVSLTSNGPDSVPSPIPAHSVFPSSPGSTSNPIPSSNQP
jgi:hypothetical protein